MSQRKITMTSRSHISKLILIALAVQISGNSLTESETEEFKKSLNLLISKGVLALNANCSYHEDFFRLNLTRQLTSEELGLGYYTLQSFSRTKSMAEYLGPFCNPSKYLQCTRKGICDCYNFNYWGVELRYVLEDGLCRIDAGSGCFIQPNKMEDKCRTGTTCLIKHNSLPCTAANLKAHKGEAPGKFVQEVCTCVPNIKENYFDYDDMEGSGEYSTHDHVHAFTTTPTPLHFEDYESDPDKTFLNVHAYLSPDGKLLIVPETETTDFSVPALNQAETTSRLSIRGILLMAFCFYISMMNYIVS